MRGGDEEGVAPDGLGDDWKRALEKVKDDAPAARRAGRR